jgi:Ricin-type beta-trefoil lectin domain
MRYRRNHAQLVDCLDVSGNNVVLAACITNKASQRWAQTKVGGTLRNQSTGTCLTASSPKAFTPLTVAACGNASNQKWHAPNVSA